MPAPVQPIAAQTQGPIWVRWVTCVVLFGLCGFGFFANWLVTPVHTQATPTPPEVEWQGIRDGTFTAELGDWLKERAWLTYQLRGIHNETRYRLGLLESERVVLADGGWMYLRAHVDGLAGRQAERQDDRLRHLAAIKALVERLDVQLLAMVVPAKPLVHPEAVYGGEVPASRLQLHTDLLDEIRAAGLQALNLQAQLREQARIGRQLYYKRDVHWNAQGSRLAADLVKARLLALGWLVPVPEGFNIGREDLSGWHTPDLVHMLGLRSVVPLGRPAEHPVVAGLQEWGEFVTLQVVDRRGGPPVRRAVVATDPASPYLLVADSFGLPQRLGSALCFALQSEVHRGFTRGAARPPTRLYDALAAIHRGELDARVVLWEFLDRHGGDERWQAPVPEWVQELLSQPR